MQNPILYLIISYLLIFLFFIYAAACLAIISFESTLFRLINSLGNVTELVTLVSLMDLEVTINDFNSLNFSGADLSCLNKE